MNFEEESYMDLYHSCTMTPNGNNDKLSPSSLPPLSASTLYGENMETQATNNSNISSDSRYIPLEIQDLEHYHDERATPGIPTQIMKAPGQGQFTVVTNKRFHARPPQGLEHSDQGLKRSKLYQQAILSPFEIDTSGDHLKIINPIIPKNSYLDMTLKKSKSPKTKTSSFNYSNGSIYTDSMSSSASEEELRQLDDNSDQETTSLNTEASEEELRQLDDNSDQETTSLNTEFDIWDRIHTNRNISTDRHMNSTKRTRDITHCKYKLLTRRMCEKRTSLFFPNYYMPVHQCTNNYEQKTKPTKALEKMRKNFCSKFQSKYCP